MAALSVRRAWLANAALLVVSLLVAFALCEWILARYEHALLLRAGIFVQQDPSVDGAAWDVDPANFERFKWQDDGNSIVHIKSDNPRLVYELRPGVKLSEEIQINSHGFRDAEFSHEKPEGVYRIVVIGDSVTFGWLQGQDEIYPEILERRLNETAPAGRRYEVFNLGVGGYNAAQELELLRSKGMAYHPDLVLVGYCSNDNQIGYDAGLWRHFTRTWSRTYDFARLRWMLWREHSSEKSLVERSYEGMAALAGEAGVPLVTVVFPDKNDAGGIHAETQTRLLAALGIDVLNLYPAFTEAGMDALLADMIHPTTAGHALAAEKILEFLQPRLAL